MKAKAKKEAVGGSSDGLRRASTTVVVSLQFLSAFAHFSSQHTNRRANFSWKASVSTEQLTWKLMWKSFALGVSNFLGKLLWWWRSLRAASSMLLQKPNFFKVTKWYFAAFSLLLFFCTQPFNLSFVLHIFLGGPQQAAALLFYLPCVHTGLYRITIHPWLGQNSTFSSDAQIGVHYSATPICKGNA